MTYTVKEVFLTLQGEGGQAGRSAVFCRFAGCNLWSGREEDRSTTSCRFCDTDFVGGERFASAEALADRIQSIWGAGLQHRLVVFTGGEPLLQLDRTLIEAVHERGFSIAIETNGTRPLPGPVDWVTVSPKAGAELVLRTGDELKLVWPQEGVDLDAMAGLPFRLRYLQPMDGPDRERNTRLCVERCLADPRWRLSLQTHKLIGIP